ncbi:TetR/AcrR family transcriptional regulator [Paenibacillus sp. CF384]|uniref:TetR/AcrR family transcriptional regulator n=1 Tax=Paenibacillus sp. CF384 TaxID=1884382 RepID=UPI0008997096|nr:TetR-like C-terminal domain-containing protein [Paenibacillus sp. CF384]SDX99482.1 transcriptional regulator, TetR family [Paenibacillus sp. CF384]
MGYAKDQVDPRIVRTRRLLRDAFIELLQEMELEKISVNRLAERATLNRVTFYLHYRDMPDMLEKMADDMIEEITSIINAPKPLIQSSAADEVEWPILVELLEHIAENHKFYKVILATKRTTVFTERLLKLLTKMISERLERPEFDHDFAASGIHRDIAIWYGSSALIGTIVSWLRNDMPYTPVFLTKQLSLLRQYKQGKL